MVSSAIKTLVVVPTYNEAANISVLTPQVLAHPEQGLLIIDDSSPDGTGAIADALAKEYQGRMQVIHRPGKGGFASAYRIGFKHAVNENAEHIVTMDADLSHPPTAIPRLVDAVRNADVAIGSRYIAGGKTENWPIRRRVVSRGGSFYTRMLLGSPILDPTSGFRCYRRSAIEQLNFEAMRASGFGFQVELIWQYHRHGLRVTEVPITFVDRKLGASKMSKRIFFEAMLLVWQLRVQEVRGLL